MKPSKRVRSAIADLQNIKENYLAYFMGDHPHFRDLCNNEIKNIENILVELAVDRKLNNIRFKKKLDIVQKLAGKDDD